MAWNSTEQLIIPAQENQIIAHVPLERLNAEHRSGEQLSRSLMPFWPSELKSFHMKKLAKSRWENGREIFSADSEKP